MERPNVEMILLYIGILNIGKQGRKSRGDRGGRSSPKLRWGTEVPISPKNRFLHKSDKQERKLRGDDPPKFVVGGLRCQFPQKKSIITRVTNI